MKATLSRVTVGEDDVDHEIFIKQTTRIVDTCGDHPVHSSSPQLVVALTMPGLTPGIENRISGWFECDSIAPDPEYVDRRTQILMTSLREQRLRLVKIIEHATVGGN